MHLILRKSYLLTMNSVHTKIQTITFTSSSNDQIVLCNLYYSFDKTHKTDGKENFLINKVKKKYNCEFELWHLVIAQVNYMVCCEHYL